MKRFFVEHPKAVGETYFQHFVAASSFGTRMVFAGIACCLHGLFPFLFARTGSEAVSTLHDRMVRSRNRKLGADTDVSSSAPSNLGN